MRNEILLDEAVFIWPLLRVLPLVAANGLLLLAYVFAVRVIPHANHYIAWPLLFYSSPPNHWPPIHLAAPAALSP